MYDNDGWDHAFSNAVFVELGAKMFMGMHPKGLYFADEVFPEAVDADDSDDEADTEDPIKKDALAAALASLPVDEDGNPIIPPRKQFSIPQVAFMAGMVRLNSSVQSLR